MYEYNLESVALDLFKSHYSSTAQTFYELKFPLTYRADFILSSFFQGRHMEKCLGYNVEPKKQNWGEIEVQSACTQGLQPGLGLCCKLSP